MSVPGGIVILDFGSQYTQLIARRIRERDVFSAILPCTASLDEVRRYQPSGVVLSGGPSSVYDPASPVCDPKVLDMGLPVLGICYGLHWITHTLGGKVERAARREYGPMQFVVCNGSQLFRGLPHSLRVWNSHGDHVVGLPPGFHLTGTTDNAIAAVENPERRIFAVEFHPEVRHTEHGADLLGNFVFEICHAKPNWSGGAFIAESVESIRRRIGDAKAICALSGGVDSAVAASLVHRAIGDRLTNVFVDTGLLRKDEYEHTLDLLRNRLSLNVEGVHAGPRFLSRLAGITDPEEK